MELKRRIERLLSAGRKADDFFQDDPLRLVAKKDAPRDELADIPAERIGRYKLLQKLGEGGMGVVYMAEQQEPVRRRVALKIIKLGMDTRAVVARFEAERQALALMDHPNIARILDGGATETGRPYFVMELVQGISITEYCDKNQLTISARIQLFMKVCEAVQSAHLKGIIHRDIKPSNVMVTLHDGVPVPKVIDFGVAKATNQELTAKTHFTNYATLIGTPAYMSPEQAEMSGLDVDTRSDIYSLGVLLYELLTGTTPFPEQRLRSVGYGEMQRIITQEEPQRLRTRISTMEGATQSAVARNRSAEAIALGNQLKGDLDSIVMRCLEKDRTRRYENATGIASDIQRHLKNEPVHARPASAAYRMHKFVRRNKVGVAVAGIVLIAILASLVTAAISYRQTQLAAIRATRFQYASDMNLARAAEEDGNLFRGLQLLERHRPGSSNYNSKIPDLRGWEWRQLWKQCQSEEIATLGSHSNDVITVGFSPDGKTAFSGGNDRILRLWDTKTMRQSGVIPHDDEVIGAAFSPDGRWLVSITDTNLIVREWPSQAIKSVVTKEWFRVNTLAFSPDSKLLAWAEYDRGIFLWDLEGGREIANFPGTFGWIVPLGLAFSPDGRTLAHTESETGEILLRNVSDLSVTRRWQAHSWYITRIFFSADGKQLISGSADRSVKVWDVASGREVNQFNYPLGFGASRVSSPRLSADGTMLATATSGGGVAISIQEIPGGREVIRLRGNKNMVSDGAFSPDGRTFISGSYDGSVRLWSLDASPKALDVRPFPVDYQEPRGPNNGFSLSPDGRHLVTVFKNATFSIHEIPNLVESPRHPLPVKNFTAVGIAAGGKLVAFVEEAGNVVFWRADTGETNWFGQPMTNGSNRAVFSLDGQRLAVGNGGKIAICDLESGQTRLFDIDNPGALCFLSFSSDGQKLMAGKTDGTVKVWDFTKANPEIPRAGDNFQVCGITLLPGEKTLVSVSRQIRFWDLETGTTRRILEPRVAVFRSVALSSDGRRLAVGAADGIITLWDLASMQEVATLTGHTRPAMDLRFLPDGNTLVSVSVNDVRVWRAAPLQEVGGRSESR